MKNSLIIILSTVIGALLGAALGFMIPFGIAQINPQDAPALSFIPILTVPAGAIIGAVICLIYSIKQVIARINAMQEARVVANQ